MSLSPFLAFVAVGATRLPVPLNAAAVVAATASSGLFLIIAAPAAVAITAGVVRPRIARAAAIEHLALAGSSRARIRTVRCPRRAAIGLPG